MVVSWWIVAVLPHVCSIFYLQIASGTPQGAQRQIYMSAEGLSTGACW